MTKGGLFTGDYRDFIPAADNCWIVTDPPYNVGYKYPGYKDTVSDSQYRALFEPMQGYRAVIINYPEVMIRSIISVLGYPEKTVAWVYNSNLKRQHRMIAWFNCKPDFSKVTQPYKNPGDKRVRQLIAGGKKGCDIYDWWDIQLVKNVSAQKRKYVNQIPEEVVSRILLTTVPPGDHVFDPFCGSGTTPLVARRLGYNWSASNISDEAIAVANELLQDSEHRED